MPNLRVPKTAYPLLRFCRRFEDPAENAIFDTFADLLSFAAAFGFYRLGGVAPTAPPPDFLGHPNPIDLTVFKNQNLYPQLLFIGLASEGRLDIARQEDQLCMLIESFAEAGCSALCRELQRSTPEGFHRELARLLQEAVQEQNQPPQL